MDLNNKCLLVLKATEPFHAWLQSVIELAEETLKQDFKHCADEKIEITLEQVQTDANCYVIPLLSGEAVTDFIEQHAEKLFEIELNTWCSLQSFWPTVNFTNFAFSFSFDFYVNWMNFQNEDIKEDSQSLANIILLLKPNDLFGKFLHSQLLDRGSLSLDLLGENLDLNLIQEGSTSVITDVQEIDDIDYFLDQHAEELISHQLQFWGGEPLQEAWSAGFDVKTLREFFSIEIHRHTYLMLH